MSRLPGRFHAPPVVAVVVSVVVSVFVTFCLFVVPSIVSSTSEVVGVRRRRRSFLSSLTFFVDLLLLPSEAGF